MQPRYRISGWLAKIIKFHTQASQPVIYPAFRVAHVNFHPPNIGVFSSPQKVSLRQLRGVGNTLLPLQWRVDQGYGAIGHNGMSAAYGRHINDLHLEP